MSEDMQRIKNKQKLSVTRHNENKLGITWEVNNPG